MKSSKPGVIIKIAVAIFAIFFVVTLVQQRIRRDELKREFEQLQIEVEQSELYVKKLQNILSSDFDLEYVKGVAKDKLNLVLPDEIIFYNDIAG